MRGRPARRPTATRVTLRGATRHERGGGGQPLPLHPSRGWRAAAAAPQPHPPHTARIAAAGAPGVPPARSHPRRRLSTASAQFHGLVASAPADGLPHARPRPPMPKRPRALPHTSHPPAAPLSPFPRRRRKQLPSPIGGRRRWCRRGATPPATRRDSGAGRRGQAGLPAGTARGGRAAQPLGPTRQ